MQSKLKSSILYRGPSLLDGQPIVAIAIVKSDNAKTGNMVQTYILREDIDPIGALQNGSDISVCGDCKHRPILGGACYVNVGQGPRAVFAAFKRGNYPVADDVAALGEGRAVRLGTYGDPMAVPAAIWRALVSKAARHTGYTHQWLNGDVDASQRAGVSALCMAFADTESEADMARSIGLRTFRVVRPDDALMTNEFICPASVEAGKRTTCAKCSACNGTRENNAANPVIIAHGAKAVRFIKIAVAA